jgi:hypothetical protein
VQILEQANSLRQFSMVFRPEDNFFEYGTGIIQDNIPFSFERKEQALINLQSLMNGETIFYVPSTEEIMRLEPLNRPHAGDNILPGGDFINENLIDH